MRASGDARGREQSDAARTAAGIAASAVSAQRIGWPSGRPWCESAAEVRDRTDALGLPAFVVGEFRKCPHAPD